MPGPGCRTTAPRGQAFLGAGALVAVAAASFVLRPVDATARPSHRPAVDVRATYLGDCGVCHGAGGRGTTRGPTLVGIGRASVDYWVSTGRMPLGDPRLYALNARKTPARHPPRYSRPVIDALVDYVASFGAGGTDIPRVDVRAANLAEGGELFRAQCAACHAWAGDGGALLHREAPSLHRATATQIAEAVRVGPGLMPAFGTAAVSDRQLDSVAAYVRYLDHPKDRGGNPLWHLGPVAEGAIAWIFGTGILVLATRWIGET